MKITTRHSILKRGYNRLKITWKNHQWLIIGGFWLVTFALGCTGTMKQLKALESLGEKRSLTDPFYRALQLYFMDDSMITSASGPALPWELELARFLAPVVAAYTAVATLAAVFREKLKMFFLRFTKNHVVICGLGRKGLLLANGFIEKGYRVVVIEQDPNNNYLEQCKDHGVIILAGNATSRELLRNAQVPKARYLISVCGDDGANAEVAVLSYELVGERRGRVLTCFVHIVDSKLCNLLREREIITEKVDSYRLEFFNVFDSGAIALLDKYPAFSETHNAQCPRPHLLLVGLGRMGESLVVHAARSWHIRYKENCGRLRITVIDYEAERKIESLYLQYPQLENVCELIPHQMDIHSPEFLRGKFLFNEQGRCEVTLVYICLDNDSAGLATGLNLLQRVRGCHIPIVVRMTHDAGLASILRGVEGGSGSFDTMHAFGLLDQTCTPEMLLDGTHEVIARAIHEDYLRNQEKEGKTPKINPSMVPWEKLPEGLRESNRRQADHIGVKLKSVGCGIASLNDWDAKLFEFTPGEIELLAEMEHERWSEERIQEGWAYAPGPKNIQKKTSPYLIPYDQLPEDIKEYDKNTVRGLPAFLAKVGFQIYRITNAINNSGNI